MNPDAIKSNVTRAGGMVLAWAAGRYHLDPTQVGAMMSDVGYLGSAAAMVYGVYAHFGMKKVPETSVAIQPTLVGAGAGPLSAAPPVGATVTGKVVG